MIHVVFAALGIFVLYYKNSFEIYGFFALLPIALYNGRKGYSSKKVQYAFYFFLSCASDSAVCDRVYIQVRNKK